MPAFHPQEPKRIELPNGMVIFLQEDHELPLINGSARIRGGSRSEPANKTGMLDMYGEVWRTGGTKSQTGDQLDDYLEIRAAKVETGSNVGFNFHFLVLPEGRLRRRFQRLHRSAAQSANFAPTNSIWRKREWTIPFPAATMMSAKSPGAKPPSWPTAKSNPYTRQPEYATVAAVTRQDLIDWHRAHVHPNNIILGIVGDFDSAAMEAKLRQVFGGWAERHLRTKPLTSNSIPPSLATI